MVLLNLERETGIEPATNGLGSRYSTIELLPLNRDYTSILSPWSNSHDDSLSQHCEEWTACKYI